jgi:hypothetical protein
MTRSKSLLLCVLLVVAGCGTSNRQTAEPGLVDCSAGDAYEFLNISNFDASGDSGWFSYADPTPNGKFELRQSVNFPDSPPRCGDAGRLELVASGLNFYGAGFGDWAHNEEGGRARGAGYEGISFWARSPGNTDKTFMLYVDDGRTIVLRGTVEGGSTAVPSGSNDQDLNGNGLRDSGDIAGGTSCRIPPPDEVGRAACYFGGALPPSTPTRVPEPDECGNRFHTLVTTTQNWQLFFLPWDKLVQFPCPNRLEGGINPDDIAMLEIKFAQGTNYEVWLDNIAFYRLRADAGR